MFKIGDKVKTLTGIAGKIMNDTSPYFIETDYGNICGPYLEYEIVKLNERLYE